MKDQFDSSSLEEFVYYRIKRAEETLSEADLLAKNGFYSGAINLLYYACYYSDTANASTHNGVRAMFALKYIKSGKMDMSHGKFFNEIFEKRHSNDYDDFAFCDKETFEYFRPKSEELIKAIKCELEF